MNAPPAGLHTCSEEGDGYGDVVVAMVPVAIGSTPIVYTHTQCISSTIGKAMKNTFPYLVFFLSTSFSN